jgi:hypothetical protein
MSEQGIQGVQGIQGFRGLDGESGDRGERGKTGRDSNTVNTVVQALLGILLTLLSWNAFQICQRLNACEVSISGLQIAGAERQVRVDIINRDLNTIGIDIKDIKRMLERHLLSEASAK